MTDRYDAGLLNDFGGGNVDWWQDYTIAAPGRAHDFYSTALTDAEATIADLTAANAALAADNARMGKRVDEALGLLASLEKAASEGRGRPIMARELFVAAIRQHLAGVTA